MGMGWGRGRRGAELLAAELGVGTSGQCACRAGAAQAVGQGKDARVWVQLGTWLSLYYLRINLCSVSSVCSVPFNCALPLLKSFVLPLLFGKAFINLN